MGVIVLLPGATLPDHGIRMHLPKPFGSADQQATSVGGRSLERRCVQLRQPLRVLRNVCA